MYDFHKKNKRQRDCKVFYHPHFDKGDREMLVKIKRKSPTNKDSKAPVSNILTEKLDKEYVRNN